ncbi:MAG: transcriptional repressor LexA [Candidatus Jacksonbacteria bacterium]|jgi:repressor LexA|nr:transcriptional repressor LexA [Candidatus Jacksonbacteria bacterium]MBT6034209.1 transcriptional repressor LexA [Candidatus Jacksonbacteria bacterium]MBT6301507.1 transcriptional repressor LexA [Candidatus Jacksonbacteria bacterium]MBT6757558.1 transcriptional repressor LexA [Candidatus Jacksonbacteria bacterium]MBT6955288.1 transcriptional repressor LexA [Candidatus Jacksonbacteria bacterium]
MKPLTPKQKKVLDFLRKSIDENGFPPSYREIAAEFGYSSVATVAQYMKSLERKGYLSTGPEARSIELENVNQEGSFMFELPLVGIIAAGEPIEAIETRETVAVPASLAGDPNAFVLRVKGDSMMDDGILDGDYVIVERSYFPQNGDVVVALLDNTYATLKRFYRTDEGVRLQPANKTMKPLFVKNPAIQGIVRGVFRKFQPA